MLHIYNAPSLICLSRNGNESYTIRGDVEVVIVCVHVHPIVQDYKSAVNGGRCGAIKGDMGLLSAPSRVTRLGMCRCGKGRVFLVRAFIDQARLASTHVTRNHHGPLRPGTENILDLTCTRLPCGNTLRRRVAVSTEAPCIAPCMWPLFACRDRSSVTETVHQLVDGWMCIVNK